MPDIGSGAAGVGAVGSLVGGIFGGGGGNSGDAILQAAGMQSAATDRAIAEQRRALDEARAYMAPYYQAGTKALDLYGGLLNIPGYAPQDPTATLRATPGYNWMMGQGVNALDRTAAARGMLQSGPQMKALTAYGQGLGDQTYNAYMNRLQGLESQGQSAAALQGAYGMQSATPIGNYLTQGAQAQGMGLVGSEMARQSGYSNQMNNLMGGLGQGLGFLRTMPQSGQNWLGSLWGGGNSLNNWGGQNWGSSNYIGNSVTPEGFNEYYYT